jgi:hypothetical protein
MVRKYLLPLFAAIVTAGCIFTGCSKENSELSEEEKKKQEMIDLLSQQIMALDLSEMMEGVSNIGMWVLSPDSTFMYLHVSGIEEGSDETTWTIDSLDGTWDKLDVNPWNEQGEAISGFRATFDLKGREDAGVIMPTEDYYFVSEEDSVKLVLSKGAIEYAAMWVDEEDLEEKAQTLSMLSTPRTRFGFLINWVIAWFMDNPTEAANGLFNAYKWVVNTLGIDSSSYNIDQDAGIKFEENVSAKIKEFQNGAETDYSNWMSQIYAGREDTPLCDMNIPGTHDTYTYYMTGVGVVDKTVGLYARTQSLDIAGQWNAGVRCFDVRFRCMDSYLLNASKLFDPSSWFEPDKPQIVCMFHQDIFCGITGRTGINEIVKLLKKHPHETAILFCAFEGEHGEADYKLARELMNEFSDYIVANPTPGMTLKDCEGKMVVFQAWDRSNNYSDSTLGPFFGTGDDTYNDHGYIQFYNLSDKPKTRLLYQNRYQSGTTDLCTSYWNEKRGLMTKCFEDAKATKGSSDYVWSVNQASGYVGGQWIHMSYTKNSNAMNPWTATYVADHKSDKLGIIQMDFAGKSETKDFDGYYTCSAGLPKLIVETNRYL